MSMHGDRLARAAARKRIVEGILERHNLPASQARHIHVKLMRDGSTRVEIRAKLTSKQGRREGPFDTDPLGS